MRGKRWGVDEQGVARERRAGMFDVAD